MPTPMDEAKEIDRVPFLRQHRAGTEAGEFDGRDKELENAPQRAPFRRELDTLQERYASLLCEHRQLKEELLNSKQPAIKNGTPQPKKNAPEGLAKAPERIIGDSAALRAVLKKVETVAPTRATVLIQGETGTGKELIAQTLHGLSQRKEKGSDPDQLCGDPIGAAGERSLRS